MARTFIGELILRLKDEMSGKAKTAARDLNSSVGRIQEAAKKLNQTSWGGQFEERLRKLGASAKDINKLREAWDQLNNSISNRKLSTALAGNERTNFKVAAISEFAAIRTAWDTHAAQIEKRTRTMAQNMKTALQPVLVALGGYTGAYLAGRMGSEGLKAASEEQRQKAEMKFSGLPENDRNRINKRAEELAQQYKMPVALFQEMLKDAALNMPSTDDALAVSDHMARGLLILSNLFGDQGASIDRMRAFNKAMDNIEKISPEEYFYGLENYMKAQQVAGKDLDPAAFAQAIKYARASGKIFSDDFLFKWLPFIISETGGSDAGTQLRAGFDQFVVGRASKQALKKQAAYGLRDKKGRLVGQNEFTENPIKWMNDVLLPRLKEKGVNIEDETELARVIGELTNNRLSGDLVMRAILSYEQYKRLAEQRLPNAQGLDAADEVQQLNPFAAWQGFVDSFKNLAGALGNDAMPTITAGLNSLASGINTLQQAWRDGDPLAKLGIGGTAFAAGFATWKIGAAIWGLMTAGTNLNAAALSLEAAAASLAAGGKGGAVDELVENGKKNGGWLAALGSFFKAARAAGATAIPGLFADSAGTTPGETMDEMRQNQVQFANDIRRLLGMDLLPYANSSGSPDERDERKGVVTPYDRATELMGRRQQMEGVTTPYNPNTPGLDFFNGAVGDAERAGSRMEDALGITATPKVDTSSIDAALAKVNALNAALSRTSGLAHAANSSVSRQMNRNFADQGVRP